MKIIVTRSQEELEVPGDAMEEDHDEEEKDLEAVNPDDLDSIAKLQRGERYNRVLRVST